MTDQGLVKQYHNGLNRHLSGMTVHGIQHYFLEKESWDTDRILSFMLRILEVDESKIFRLETDRKLREVTALVRRREKQVPDSAVAKLKDNEFRDLLHTELEQGEVLDYLLQWLDVEVFECRNRVFREKLALAAALLHWRLHQREDGQSDRRSCNCKGSGLESLESPFVDVVDCGDEVCELQVKI